MAVTAGVGAGVGIAAAAGATAAAIRARQQKTQPRGQTYGGQYSIIGTNVDPLKDPRRIAAQSSGAARGGVTGVPAQDLGPGWRNTEYGRIVQERFDNQSPYGAKAKANPYQLDFNRNRAEAQGVVDTGLAGVASASQAAEQQRLIALGLMQGDGPGFSTAGSDFVAGYQPGQVSQTMAQQVLNRNAQANLGAARSGGALGLRNALNANAQAGVNAQADMAAQAAQEQERYLAAQVNQANADRAAQMAQVGQGIGLAQGALGQGLNAGQAYTSAGLNLENNYLDAEQRLNEQKLMADMDYDRRRQAENQRKSDRLWNLSGSLLGIAGKAFGSAGGGG